MNEANKKALNELLNDADRRKAEKQAAERQRERDTLTFRREFNHLLDTIVAPAFKDFLEVIEARGVNAYAVQGLTPSDHFDDLPDAPFQGFVFGLRDRTENFGSIEITVDLKNQKIVIVRTRAGMHEEAEPETLGDGSLSALTEDAVHAELRTMLEAKLALD